MRKPSISVQQIIDSEDDIRMQCVTVADLTVFQITNDSKSVTVFTCLMIAFPEGDAS